MTKRRLQDRFASDPDDTRAWLESRGFGAYWSRLHEEKIALSALFELTHEDLRYLSIPLGVHKSMLAELRRTAGSENPALDRLAEAEMRQLSVLMTDLVGSTHYSRTLHPAQYEQLISALRNVCDEAVATYGGEIRQYEGDGLLAYFGYPVAHGDDAIRSVLAGLAIGTELADAGLPFAAQPRCRFGIATGHVMVVPVSGPRAEQQGGAHGETPILARRLQSAADPGEIMVCATTLERVQGRFFFAPPVTLQVKGFDAPVNASQVRREHAGARPLRAAGQDELAPLAGRDNALGVLQDAWAAAASGRGGTVAVSGESGIGKSRIVQAFEERLGRRDIFVIRCQCSEYHSGTAFYPVLAMLRRFAGLSGTPSGISPKRSRFGRLIHRLVPQVDSAAPFLREFLLSGPAPEPIRTKESPEARKEAILSNFMDVLSTLQRERTVLLIVEDLQWLDGASLELLQRVAEFAHDHQLLILATLRAEADRALQLPIDKHLKVLPLQPLSRTETVAMIDGLTAHAALPAKLVEDIVRKSNGVPLFVEEYTKAIRNRQPEAEEQVRELINRVPPAIENPVLARLDRLAVRQPAARRLTTTASVLGTEFSIKLLSAVSAQPRSSVMPIAETIVEAGLWTRRGSGERQVYRFRHDALRDAAYGTLVPSRKRELHAMVADTVGKVEPALAREQPELLAHHQTEAGNLNAAIGLWREAGLRAASLAAHTDAAAHFKRGLEVAGKLPAGTPRLELELEFLLQHGDALRSAIGTHAESARDAFAQALPRAQQLGRPEQVAHALYGHFSFHFEAAQVDKGRQIARSLIEYGEAKGHPQSLATGHQAFGISAFIQGRFTEAREHLEAVIVALPELEDLQRLAYSQIPFTSYTYLAWTLYVMGMQRSADQRCEHVLSLSCLGNSYQRALTLANVCNLYQMSGRVDLLSEHAVLLADHAWRNGLPAWLDIANFLLGWRDAGSGDRARGLDAMRATRLVSSALTDVGQCLIETPFTLGMYAERLYQQGRAAQALQVLERALAVCAQTGERWYESELRRLESRCLLLCEAGRDTVIEPLTRSLELAREQNAICWQLRTSLDLADCYTRWGEPARARELLEHSTEALDREVNVAEVATAKRRAAR